MSQARPVTGSKSVTYTNDDLYTGVLQNDELFVVTGEPQIHGDSVVVDIELELPAVVFDRHAQKYDQPYTVSDIRAGRTLEGKSLWLLSGGTLIRDEQGRFAIGLRDGNAADPFTYTNIGAGRCNSVFEDHCLEEMSSEFVLCVKDAGEWNQVRLLDSEKPPLLSQLREQRQSIARWMIQKVPAAGLVDYRLTNVKQVSGSHAGMQTLTVRWLRSGQVERSETLHGFMLIDARNHTVEFRLGYDLDLSAYGPEETQIFFAEGTGYAEWMSEDRLRQLAHLGMVPPFIQSWLAKARSS